MFAHPHGARSAAEETLKLCAEIGADLLVMGRYGHSCPRKTVSGGATSRVLHDMTLPD